MSTVDHKARHVWTQTPIGIRCAYMTCRARPDDADVARLEADEARARDARIATAFVGARP